MKALEKARERGHPVPALDNRPILESDLAPVFQCWTFCHSRRQLGWGPSPITISDMLAALDVFYVAGDLRDDWIELLVALDQEYLRWVKRTAPKPGGKDPARHL